MRQDERVYGATSIALHWCVAAGIVGMLAFGFVIGGMEPGPGKTAAIQTHKSFGILIGTLALVRLVRRATLGFAPALPGHTWEVRAARLSHEALLLMTVLMPLTGILKSVTYARPVEVFGLPLLPKLLDTKHEAANEIVSVAHAVTGYLLAALIALHVAAALKHALLDRDPTFARIVRPTPTARY